MFMQILNIAKETLEKLHFRGHPFITFTRRGEGVKPRWTHVDGRRRGEVRADVHTENFEIYNLRVKMLNFRVND